MLKVGLHGGQIVVVATETRQVLTPAEAEQLSEELSDLAEHMNELAADEEEE